MGERTEISPRHGSGWPAHTNEDSARPLQRRHTVRSRERVLHAGPQPVSVVADGLGDQVKGMRLTGGRRPHLRSRQRHAQPERRVDEADDASAKAASDCPAVCDPTRRPRAHEEDRTSGGTAARPTKNSGS